MQALTQVINNLQLRLQNPLPGHSSYAHIINSERLKSTQKPDAKTRQSAVLILLFEKAGEVQLPLILRPPYDGTHGGQVGLPGGKKEHFDENLQRTALREAQEEIGVKALDVKILADLTEVYIPVSNYLVQPVLGYMSIKPSFYPDKREVEKIIMTKITDLLRPDLSSNRLIDVQGRQIEVPGFEIDGHWVWGATALILSELIELLKES